MEKRLCKAEWWLRQTESYATIRTLYPNKASRGRGQLLLRILVGMSGFLLGADHWLFLLPIHVKLPAIIKKVFIIIETAFKIDCILRKLVFVLGISFP